MGLEGLELVGGLAGGLALELILWLSNRIILISLLFWTYLHL
jgi:hypothetical protein